VRETERKRMEFIASVDKKLIEALEKLGYSIQKCKIKTKNNITVTVLKLVKRI